MCLCLVCDSFAQYISFYFHSQLGQHAGTPQLHADVNVSIAVTDLNDNEPRFDSVSYDVTTIENKPVGTGLLIVTVTDDDIGVNADVTLSIDTSTVAGARAAQFFEVV